MTALQSHSNIDIQDFDKAIAAIDEVRKYKALKNMSLGKELESYAITTQVSIATYGEFIRGVGRIKTLK